MAKQTGLGDQLFVQGFDIGGDVQSIGNLSTPRAVIEQTGITSSAFERNFGLRDGVAEFVAFFNDAIGAAHPTLSTLPRTDVNVMYLRGLGLGNSGIGLVAKQIGYDPNRGDDGSLTINVQTQANAFGLDWGTQLTTGKQTFASAGAGTSVDFGVGTTNFGLQAYIQVFSIGSGTATVAVQSSSDNGGGDAFANVTGGVFTPITAAGAERIQTTDTLPIERYLRLNVTGTFTNLVCAVVVTRNEALRAI